MSELSTTDQTSVFQEHVVALTRAFGWHRPSTTPCGKPVPIAEAHALLELSKVESLTQRELADSINLRKSTVSRLVSNLERRGWILRERNGEDGRARDVRLTAQGEQIAADLAVARQGKMTGVLAKIPEDQRASVMDSLQTLIEAIRENDE